MESKMSAKRKWAAIALVVGLLLIFSVTGPMLSFFTGIFAPGPAPFARIELPSGDEKVIDSEAYRQAGAMLAWDERVFGFRAVFYGAEGDTETTLAMATLLALADDMDLVVSDEVLRPWVQGFVQQGLQSGIGYDQIVRSFGFAHPADFESLLRSLLRIHILADSVLGATAVPDPDEALARWADQHEEFRLEFLRFEAEDFAEAAASLEPEEEELQRFFEEDLTPVQRSSLEDEARVRFEVVALERDQLQSEAVKAWADLSEPSEEALKGFYDLRKHLLYRRPPELEEETAGEEAFGEGGSGEGAAGGPRQDPPAEEEEEGAGEAQSAAGEEAGPPLPPQEPWYSMEELGDRLQEDFLLRRAVESLRADLEEAEDVEAFCTERGLTHIAYLEEAVPRSELQNLPRIGSVSLLRLVSAEAGSWLPDTFQAEDLAFLVRVEESIPRQMPPFEEIRDSVADFWREAQQGRLAREAAAAFLDGLPRPAGQAPGDPVRLDSEAFQEAAAAAGGVVEVLDWISRVPRPPTDPLWAAGEERTFMTWLRRTAGNDLDIYETGEVFGPLEGSDGETFVVARLDGRREPDLEKLWPSDYTQPVYGLRSLEQQIVQEKRRAALTYESLARQFRIERLNLPEPVSP